MANKQIWLIDDDEITNVINKKTLAIHFSQYEVVIFDSPLDALEKLMNGEATPHCILLDINMPIIDGWEFLQMMQQQNLKNSVIMLTSSFYKEDMVQASAYKNVRHFMTKPINVKELSKVLKKI